MAEPQKIDVTVLEGGAEIKNDCCSFFTKSGRKRGCHNSDNTGYSLYYASRKPRENRIEEKLITVLLAMAAVRFHQERGVRSLNQFARNINHIVNTRILGTVVHPKQWKVPISDSGDSVVKVSLSNNKTCTFIYNLDYLVDHVFSNPIHEEQKQIWKQMLNNYWEAMIFL